MTEVLTYEALKAERDALAVESAALKARCIKLFNLGYLRGHESTVEGYFVDVHWCDIDTYHDDVVAEIIEDEDETPATDAALAAIREQACKALIDAFVRQVDAADLDDSDSVTIFECRDTMKYAAEQAINPREAK